MKTLSQTGAEHFVQRFSASALSGGVYEHLQNNVKGTNIFIEGTSQFSELRDCLLRESDRCLLLSVSCFARALDGMRAASSYWTLVGLYYSAFFAAKAVLGMFGCWMGNPKMWVEAVDTNPGKQSLAYRRVKHPESRRGGSHQATWRAYYVAMVPLNSWVPSSFSLAVHPVHASKTWFIDTRNEFNYHPSSAVRLGDDFAMSFDPSDLPNCLPGSLNTAFNVSSTMLKFARHVATQFSLSTDVFGGYPSRADGFRALVTAPQDPALRTFSASLHPILEF